MSTDLPFFYNYYNPLLAGEGYGGLMQLWPLFLQKMQGYPVQFPGIIPESGGYNYYDNYWLNQMTMMNSASYSQARELDAESQGAMLSLVAKRVFEATGHTLSQQQMAAIQQAAGLIGKYGPVVTGNARRFLQQQGIEDETGQRIDGILGIIENAFDATYGPTGSRLPFYGSVKQSLINLVPKEKHDDILQESMQKMFPLQQDVQATGGYGARQVAEIHSYLSRMGHNSFNTESPEVKRLVQQKMEGGLSSLSDAERRRYIEAAQRQATERLFRGTTNRAAKEAVMGDTTDDKVNYVNALNNIQALNKAVRDTNIQTAEFINSGKDISSMTVENMEKLAADLSGKATYSVSTEANEAYKANIDELNRLQEKKDKTDEDKQQIKDLTELIAKNKRESDYYIKLSNQVKAFSEIARKVDDFRKAKDGTIITAEEFNKRVDEAQMNLFKEAVKGNEQTKNLVSDEELNNYARTFIIQDRLKRVKGLKTELLDLNMKEATDEQKKKREEYLNDILNDKNNMYSEDVKQDIKALYTTKGQTEDYSKYNQFYGKLGENIKSLETLQQTIKEYTSKKTEDERNQFLAAHPELRRFEAQIVSDRGAEALQREARNVSRMQSAITATGGGTINGKPILSVNQVQQTMDMIAQMTGRDQLTDEEWEDYWTKIAYTMTQSGTNINDVQQIAGIAARGAAKFGGDRGTTSMAAVELGLAAQQVAAIHNINPERAGLLVAQAAGAASNSRLTHFANAFAHLLSTKDVKDFTVDEKYKPILEKIQKRQSLTTDELRILDREGNKIMDQMGISASRQSTLINMATEGDVGNYALKIGAMGKLTEYTQEISRNSLTKYFKGINADKETQNKIKDIVFNAFTKDKDIRKQRSGVLLKERLIAEAKEANMPASVIKQIEAMDAQEIWEEASKASYRVANNLHNGDINAVYEQKALEDDLGKQVDANETESKIKALLPFSTDSSIKAVMKALGDPASTAGSIVKSIMTGDHLTTDDKGKIANALALVSLVQKDYDTSMKAGFTEEQLKQVSEAGDIVNDVFRKTKNAKVLTAFSTLQNTLNNEGLTIQQARKKSKGELARRKFTPEEIKLIKETEITDEQFKVAQTTLEQHEKFIRGQIDTYTNEVQESTRQLKAQKNENSDNAESTPVPVNSTVPKTSTKPAGGTSETSSSGENADGEAIDNKLKEEKPVEVVIVGDRRTNNNQVPETSVPGTA